MGAHGRNLPTYLQTLIAILVFLAFLPLPQPIGTGLDPSWRYALSHFADHNTFTNVPIVFTYGRWGYLVRGAATPQSFVSIFTFRLVVYTVFFFLGYSRIIGTKDLFGKLSIFLALLLPLSLSEQMPMFQTEAQIVMSGLLVFSNQSFWASSYRPLFILVLGLIAGLLFHFKVSLGMYIAPSLILFVLGNTLSQACGGEPWARKLKPGLTMTLCACIGISAGVLIGSIGTSALELDLYKQISSAYASAMSRSGPLDHLFIGAGLLAVILYLAFAFAREDRSLWGFCAATIFISALTFKHAYVRPGHFLRFLIFAPVIIALLSPARSIKTGGLTSRLPQVLAFGALAIGIIYATEKYPADSQHTNKPLRSHLVLLPMQIKEKIRSYLNPETLQRDLQLISSRNLEPLRIDDKTRSMIGFDTVDIFPTEISIAPANNLNWHPRPIFQSYQAYTSDLDQFNRKYIANNPPKWILMHWGSLDGRHQLHDEPSTSLEILCTYKFVRTAKSKLFDNILLLHRNPSTVCTFDDWTSLRPAAWNEPVPVEKNKAMIASIHIRYSWIGKAAKILFRLPPVRLRIQNHSGRSIDYRIIPEVAKSGLLISPLPANSNQLAKLFQGSLPPEATTITIMSSNTWLYHGAPLVSLRSFTIEPR